MAQLRYVNCLYSFRTVTGISVALQTEDLVSWNSQYKNHFNVAVKLLCFSCKSFCLGILHPEYGFSATPAHAYSLVVLFDHFANDRFLVATRLTHPQHLFCTFFLTSVSKMLIVVANISMMSELPIRAHVPLKIYHLQACSTVHNKSIPRSFWSVHLWV